MKEVIESAIPLLVRRGGREVKKMPRSLLIKERTGWSLKPKRDV